MMWMRSVIFRMLLEGQESLVSFDFEVCVEGCDVKVIERMLVESNNGVV
jgi:hypothetical protein